MKVMGYFITGTGIDRSYQPGKSVQHSKWVGRGNRSCFDRLSTNGFHAIQLIFLGSTKNA